MLLRKIAAKIENYLKSTTDKILFVEGARQVGKSYTGTLRNLIEGKK